MFAVFWSLTLQEKLTLATGIVWLVDLFNFKLHFNAALSCKGSLDIVLARAGNNFRPDKHR